VHVCTLFSIVLLQRQLVHACNFSMILLKSHLVHVCNCFTMILLKRHLVHDCILFTMTSLKRQQVNVCNLFTIMFLKRQLVYVCTLFSIILLTKSSVLSNPKFHYGVHNCPPPVANPRLPNDVFPQGFHNKTMHKPSFPHTCYIPSPSLSSLFYDPKNFECVVQIIKLLNIKFSPHSCNLVPHRLK